MKNPRTALRSLKKSRFVWRYISNFASTLRYAAGVNGKLTDLESRLVAQLNENGFAVTSIEDLITDFHIDELQHSVSELLKRMTNETSKLRISAGKTGPIGSKTFNLEMLGSELTFDPTDVFARFALNDSFLRVANAYFKMVSKLRYYNVWYTAASNTTARESQLWHFDREDNYIIKVFLYLDDVDEGTGPFTYAPGTHKKGRFRLLSPEFFDEGGVKRTTDQQMGAVYPRSDWKTCTGRKGTLIFADTRGYHKGGEARTSDRLMYTCMYTSPASESKRLIRFPEDLDTSTLSRKQRQALLNT